jgi:antitoxin VapB
MALCIRNPHAEKLARDVAAQTGENITQAIIHALEERLERINGRKQAYDIKEEILKISERCSSLPDKDRRTEEEILGYDPQTGGTRS